MTARVPKAGKPEHPRRSGGALRIIGSASAVACALAASAIHLISAGGAAADATSTACADLLASADLALPIEISEDPGGQGGHPVDQAAHEMPGAYGMELYGSGADDILYIAGPENGVIAGDGDDRIFVFDAQARGLVLGEGGGDTVIFCSVATPFSGVTLNSSVVNSDSEPDMLVLGPDVFRAAAGFGRSVIPWGSVQEEIGGARILVTGFDPRTDRVVLRPPWPVEIRPDRRNTYDQRIQAGPVELVFAFSEEGLDPLPAVSVSQAPEAEGIAGLDLAALLASRRVPPDPGGAASPEADHGGGGPWDWLRGEGDGHGGEGHGAAFERLAGSRAVATRCGDFLEPSARDAAVPDRAPDAYDERESTWRDGADTLAYFGDGVPHNLMAGGGDDLIWLFGIEEGTEFVAGDGSDLVILCSVEDVSAVVWLGRGNAGLDDEPDTLVIAPEVLEHVPAGFQRIITLYEYDPRVDRLVLPPGPWQPVVEMHGAVVSPDDTAEAIAFDAKVTYGPMRVTLGLGQPTDPATLHRSISVGGTDPRSHVRDLGVRIAARIGPPAEFRPVDPSTWSRARTLAGGAIGGKPPGFDCGAPPVATERPRKPELDEHDALLVEYGYTNDVIVVRNMAESPGDGFLSQSEVRSGHGRDIVYSFSGNATLVDGPDFDLTVICDMDGLTTGLVSRSDGSPDIVIVDAAVFRKPLSQGFARRISISGYGESQDYLILRLPAGARIEPDRYLVSRFHVVTPEATTSIDLSAAFNEQDRKVNHDERLQPDRIILWKE